jgi:hypothetical protein
MREPETDAPEPREERGEAPARLMPHEDEQTLRSRWTAIQSAFVDEPARSVQQADELVAEVMSRITNVFGAERSKLEERWARQEKASTESLRVVLQRYRSFFDRLLGMTAH